MTRVKVLATLLIERVVEVSDDELDDLAPGHDPVSAGIAKALEPIASALDDGFELQEADGEVIA